MRRDFSSREELADYLRSEFPAAAGRDPAISPIRGGQAAAEQQFAQISPLKYAATRNHLSGAVTQLSPYIRHGLLTLAAVRDHAVRVTGSARPIVKFISELAWRDYWQRIYQQIGDGIWVNRESLKTGRDETGYAQYLSADILDRATGLACIDAFIGELYSTGYLHNHARMWLAAYVVHWRRIQWQAGARWFLTHLLDGDPASNNLSWQWIASTFSSKPYFFNRENLEKYTDARFCTHCTAREHCPFEGSYEDLEKRLFPTEAAP